MSMFVDVIKSAAVVKDGGFQLASVPVSTTTAFNTATQLVEWMSKTRNQEELDVFAVKVLTRLRSCLPQRTAAFRKARREAMWKSYYQLHTSPSSYGRSLLPRQWQWIHIPFCISTWQTRHLKLLFKKHSRPATYSTANLSWNTDIRRRKCIAVCSRVCLSQAPEDYSIKTPNERQTPSVSHGPVWRGQRCIQQCWLGTCSWQGWTCAC